MEQFRDLMLLQLGADDAELTGDVGAAGADLVLTGDHVELVPGVAAVHNALGAQDHAVSALVQRVQGLVQILTAVFVGRLLAPAREHLVGVVAVMMVMMAAVAVVMMLMLVMVIVVFVVVVVMAAAAMIVVVLMIVMMLMLVVVIVILVVIVVMMMAAAAMIVAVLMIVMVLVLLFLILSLIHI
mgnify:CR=1 FL=1